MPNGFEAVMCHKSNLFYFNQNRIKVVPELFVLVIELQQFWLLSQQPIQFFPDTALKKFVLFKVNIFKLKHFNCKFLQINFLDYKISQYIPIHSKMIRDMALSNQNNDEILLSCGLDKMLKLTNIATNRIIHRFFRFFFFFFI